MSDIKHRQLGHHGPAVSSIGLGCMSLSGTYGEADDGQSMSLIHHAIDMGINHLDSSDMYGWGHNESVVGAALKGRPEHVRAACDASLKRMGHSVLTTEDAGVQRRGTGGR